MGWWDRRAADGGSRALLARTCRGLLARDGISLLAGHLTRSRCAREEDTGVSNAMAHKAFRSNEELLVEAADGVFSDGDWSGFTAGIAETVGAFVEATGGRMAEPGQVEIALQAALKANFDHQFRSPGVPPGWLLTAAAMPFSDAWELEAPRGPTRAAGEQILALRRAQYEQMTEQMTSLMSVAMSGLQLRPTHGLDERTIVVLLHCLHDGAVLRRTIDPEAVDGELVARAMVALGVALSQRGSVQDPRLPPSGESNSRVSFDRLIEVAWVREPIPTSVAQVADAGGVPLALAEKLFPTIGDLYDSMLRNRVANAGVDPTPPADTQTGLSWYLAVLYGQLSAIAEVVRSHPELIAAVATATPRVRPGLRAELTETIAARLGATFQDGPGSGARAARLASNLAEFAFTGELGAARALLEQAGLPLRDLA